MKSSEKKLTFLHLSHRGRILIDVLSETTHNATRHLERLVTLDPLSLHMLPICFPALYALDQSHSIWFSLTTRAIYYEVAFTNHSP